MTRTRLFALCSYYNKQEYRRFIGKNAETRFLHPTGLGIDKIPKHFEQCQDQMVWAEEKLLFEALHYLRYRLKKALPPNIINRPPSKEQLKIVRTLLPIRNRIAIGNLALVSKCIKHTGVFAEICDLQSSGRLTLISATERFDPWRGWRFSTYACNAILRNFLRLLPKKRRIKIMDGFDPSEEMEPDYTDPNKDYFLERLKIILQQGVHNLSNSEVDVIIRRYGLSLNENEEGPKTLEAVGLACGVSKERIRQVQMVAIKKLKTILDNVESS